MFTPGAALGSARVAITFYPTFWFGLAVGLPFMAVAYNLAMHAIDAKADLTATSLVIGAIAAGVSTLMAIFVNRAKAADAVKAP